MTIPSRTLASAGVAQAESLVLAVGAAASAECAEQWLSSALHEARQQGDRLTELRASYDLARPWAEQDEFQNACDLLAPICGWFGGRGDLRDMAEAAALLNALP